MTSDSTKNGIRVIGRVVQAILLLLTILLFVGSLSLPVIAFVVVGPVLIVFLLGILVAEVLLVRPFRVPGGASTDE